MDRNTTPLHYSTGTTTDNASIQHRHYYRIYNTKVLLIPYGTTTLIWSKLRLHR